MTEQFRPEGISDEAWNATVAESARFADARANAEHKDLMTAFAEAMDRADAKIAAMREAAGEPVCTPGVEVIQVSA